MTTYKGLTVEIGATTKDLQKALSEANKGARQTANELKQIEKALDFNPTSTRLLTRQVELIGDKADQTRKRLDVLKAAEEQIGRANMSTEQWTKLQAEIATCESKLETFTNQLAKARIELSSASTLMGRAGASLTDFGERYQSAGDRLKSVGSTLTNTVTPAIGILGGATIAAATSIDTSLTGVKKTVDGTAQQYEQLKDAAIDFSKTNAVSASQILDIQALGAQLGFTIDELRLFSEVVSGLDIATNMDAETAATEMAQFANITRMSHDEVENYGSAIVGLGNNFATTEADISSMAMRIAAAGTQVGMSQADILGLATALSSLGMEAEAGGSAISTIISNIDKAVATNSDALATWASSAGMSAESFASAWKSGPVDALALVLSGLQGATEAGGNMSLMLEELGINELRQTDSMKRMAGNAQLVTDAVATANDEWSKNTALSKEVENRNDSLAAKFEMLKNRAIAVADGIGGPLADALLEALDAARPLFDAIESGAKSFSEMSTQEQQAVLGFVALAAAAGPLLQILGSVPALATSLGGALTTASKAMAAMSTGASLASVGLSSLKGGIVGVVATLALLAAALGAKAFFDYQSGIEQAKDASDGLRDSTSALGRSYDDAKGKASAAAGGTDEYATSVSDAVAKVDAMTAANAEMADSIAETLGNAGTTAGQLDAYAETVDELAGRSDLTAGEVARLEEAIDGVNELCGTSYSVVEGFSGSYDIMADGARVAKEEILDLVDAMKLQVQFDAAKDAYAEAYGTLADNAKTAAEATQAYKEAQEAADQAAANGDVGLNTLGASWQELQGKADKAKAAMDEENASYRAQSDVVAELEGSLNLLTKAQDAGAGSIAAVVAGNVGLTASLQAAGKSADDFVADMEGAGVSAEGFAALSEDQVANLASVYDGTFGSIQELLSGYGVAVDDAKAKTQLAFEQMQSSSVWLDQGLTNALIGANTDVATFVTALQNAGMSVQTFGALNAQELAFLAQNYDGTTQSIAWSMQSLVAQSGLFGSQAGQAWYNGLSSNAQLAVGATALMTGQSVAQLMQAASQFGIQGSDAVQRFCDALNAGATPANAAACALGKSAEDGFDPNLEPTATERANAACDAISGAPGGAAGSTLAGSANGGFSGSLDLQTPASSEASAAVAAISGAAGSGNSAGNVLGVGVKEGYAAGIEGLASVDVVGVLTPPLSSAEEAAQQSGDATGGNFASGVSSSVGQTQAAAQSHANATTAMNANSASAFAWGSHMGSNFASGLSSQVGAVSSAASSLAAAAAGPLRHTTPDEGPLKDDDVWGVHLAQNFADGMSDGARYVGKSALEIAQTVVDYLGHTQPEKGPLRGGEWVFGYHAATNFADGLYSGAPEVAEAAAEVASGVSAGMEEGVDDADAEMRAYVDGMIAGWEDRSDEVRETSTAIGDALWGGIYQSVMSSPWRKPATGAVYDSLKVLEAYGYDLESYKDKVADFGEKRAEWDSKLAGEMSDTDWQSYNEWLSDYNDFTDMQAKLTASMSDMEEWASLYALKDAAISGIDNAQAWSDALSKLTSKTGVVFRKEFVDAVVDGGDEYLAAIQQMGDMTDEQVQGMVDAFTDLSLAQKQQELDQRSLYVNSLKYSDMTTPKERMIEFRETLLDVKEAVYSDAGLSGAFEKAGVSIEGFGADLQSLDVTMEDFVAGLDGYTSAVSDGFSQFTKHGKTGLDEWEETLRLNMAESQAWADNLEAVFAKVPESIDSEAFRKAVYEGGFDQWGQVIADMAGKSSEEIASYIRLYNESVAQAQTDGLDAFRALAPGEEMMNTVIAGITAQQPALDQSVVDASTASNEAMLETSPQWYSTGVGLAGQISSGIQSQISAIASAAASTVRAAIEAAQAAAGSGVSAATANMPATASMSRGPSVPTAATLASSQSVRSVSAASPVSMSFTVNTQPGQTVDVRQLAKEINKMQDRAMRAKGL